MNARKLPKGIDADPRAETLLKLLDGPTPAIRAGDELIRTLQSALRQRRVVRGIDAATKTLANEQRGLAQADRKAGTSRGNRISRVLFVANDGSAGFYRQVDKLVAVHAGRLLAVRLDVDAAALGGPLFGPGREARALLIAHKDAVASTLLSLVPDPTED